MRDQSPQLTKISHCEVNDFFLALFWPFLTPCGRLGIIKPSCRGGSMLICKVENRLQEWSRNDATLKHVRSSLTDTATSHWLAILYIYLNLLMDLDFLCCFGPESSNTMWVRSIYLELFFPERVIRYYWPFRLCVRWQNVNSQISLNTCSIVSLLNPIDLWLIAWSMS